MEPGSERAHELKGALMSVAPTDDVVSLLTQDHAAVKQRFAEFDDAPVDVRAELFWKLTDQLIRHEVAEEVVVYPILRKLPGGDAIADARVAEESEAEQQLARMEKMDPTTQEFLGAIKDLQAAVLEHATKEEQEAFPILLANEEGAYLIQLGQKYKGAKLAAPNHPHPHAPDSPTAQKVLGPIAALIDRIRDSAKSA
jgi:iron-sulfur cluster repair protein YtfE (RIC family)